MSFNGLKERSMLDALEVEIEVTMPGPWPTLYLITERRGSKARDDDPEARSGIRRGHVYDLRAPGGKVIETSADLGYLRDRQARYNIVALGG
jgi:hypothetical protein